MKIIINLTTLFMMLVFVAQAQNTLATNYTFSQNAQNKMVLAEQQTYERSLQGNEANSFYINLEKNEFAIIEVIQDGTDVVLSSYDSNNKPIISVDSTNGDFGPEIIYLLSYKPEVYRLEVKSTEKPNKIGKYKIQVVEKRISKPEDAYLIKAQEAFSKGYRARYDSSESVKSAISYYKEALNNWVVARQSAKEAETLYLLGYCSNETNDYFEAKQYYLKALELQIKLNDKRGKVLTELGLGQVYLSLKDDKNGSEYLLLALRTAKEINDKKSEIEALTSLGIYYCSIGKFLESSNYFNNAIEISTQIGDDEAIQEIKTTMKRLLIGNQ